MKKLLLFLFVTATVFVYGQQKPVQWSFSSGITADGKHQLLIKGIIEKGTKLLSTNVIPGFDGVKTEFKFDTASSKKIAGTPTTANKAIEEKSAALGNVSIQYYTDSVFWTQDVNVAKGDSFRIKGDVNYYTIKGDQVETFSEKISKEFIYSDVTKKAMPTGRQADQAQAADKNSNPYEGKTIFGLLLTGILVGLIAFLTPCVYSLVPVTVSLFLKRSKTPSQGRKSALFYSFSIVFIYTLIAVLSRAFTDQTIWNTISASWQFNLFVFVLFVIFGLSFLGAFEISLPSSWATKADKKSGFGSYGGIFFMALTLVIVSFSCTGNFVTLILSSSNNAAAIFGMLGFGIGLALPFTLFAFFPSLLKEISKPGGWQNALKVSLGIIELALAMKFLSNADVQLGKYWFTRDVYLALWIALFVFLAVYLLGGFRMKHDSDLPKNDWDKTYIPIPRFFFALASLGFAIYLIPGLLGAPLNNISGLLPPYGTQEYTGTTKKAVSSTDGNKTYTLQPVKYFNDLIRNESAAAKNAGLVTFYDYDEAMAAAKEQGKPLMIDFTGIVCPNCREFENRVWTKPEVMDRMKNKFVVASLFEDFTQELPDAEKKYSELLGKNIETVGDKFKDLSMKLTGGISQPNYVFLNHDGSKILENGYGYDGIQKNGTDDFVKHLDLALEKFKK